MGFPTLPASLLAVACSKHDLCSFQGSEEWAPHVSGELAPPSAFSLGHSSLVFPVSLG